MKVAAKGKGKGKEVGLGAAGKGAKGAGKQGKGSAVPPSCEVVEIKGNDFFKAKPASATKVSSDKARINSKSPTDEAGGAKLSMRSDPDKVAVVVLPADLSKEPYVKMIPDPAKDADGA